MANTISTSGIQSGSVIRAENLSRIIDALSGVANNDIYITGSVGITGSLSLQSGSIPETGSGDSPYVLTYDLNNSDIPNNTSYNAGTGVWDLSGRTIASGATVVLKIAATVNTVNFKLNTTEIFKTEQKDTDSNPGSGN